MYELSKLVKNNSEELDKRSSQLEENMGLFKQEIKDAQEFMESVLKKKADDLEEEKSALRSTLAKARKMFGG
jgi:hypothetical protein